MTFTCTISVKAARARRCRRLARGFSLLEIVISVSLLVVITGAVLEQIMVMQKSAASTGAKVDTDQQARAFVDQMVRDLHMAGYPKAEMYSSATLDNTSPLVAAGVVSVSPTQIILEGDVNSDGFVESVNVGYVGTPADDPGCPCIRRSSVEKITGNPLAQPVSANYTETSGVVPPGSGPGQAGADLFTFYDQNGNQVDVSDSPDINTNPTKLASLATVKINLSLLTSAGAGQTARTSISATARLNQ
jgi:type II secretory pathway pseudopilin PulG